MAKGDGILERLIEFAVRVLRLCDELPDKPAGRQVRGQLLRSGTARHQTTRKRAVPKAAAISSTSLASV